MEREFLCDIHCISSLLKQYFRQLPNPLFTYECYAQLITAYESDPQKRIDCLREVVRLLPLANFRAAALLMKHLRKMSKYKSITDMNANNLAIVWAPNLIRCPPRSDDSDVHLLIGLDLHKSICHFLILHAAAIFDEDNAEESLTASEIALEEMEFIRHKENNGATNGNCIELNGGPASVPTAFHTVIHRKEIEKAHPDSFSSWRKFVSLPIERPSGHWYMQKQKCDAGSLRKVTQRISRLSSGFVRSQSVDNDFDRRTPHRWSIFSLLGKNVAGSGVVRTIKSVKENFSRENKKASIDKEAIITVAAITISPSTDSEKEKVMESEVVAHKQENLEKTELAEECLEEEEGRKRVVGFDPANRKFSYKGSASKEGEVKSGADKGSTESLLVSRYDNVLMSSDKQSNLAMEGTLSKPPKSRCRPLSTPI